MEIEHTHHQESVFNDAEEERKNFSSVVAAFKSYRSFSMDRVNRTEMYLNTLKTIHQEMLIRYRDNLNSIRDCIDQNHKIIRKLSQDIGSLFQNGTRVSPECNHGDLVKQMDLENVQMTLKQFARDWSSVGKEEREQCYKPIIDEITAFYNPEKTDVGNVKILVPGAGLGRLSYELAYRGYYCEGNEFSLIMLTASNFVLNRCVVENQYTLYPWVHQYVNNQLRSDQISPITFPDVSPTLAPPKGTFNMIAGDFLEAYKIGDFWDCVATCFFIDCANNVIEFIENIFNILRPGAIWVNLGPLLYHYSDILNEGSIEPSYEDLVGIIEKVGFEFLKKETGIKTKYCQNPNSMQQHEYLSIFFVCRKPLENETIGFRNSDEENHN